MLERIQKENDNKKTKQARNWSALQERSVNSL